MIIIIIIIDHWLKLKKNEKWDKYFDIAWKLEKLWNMKVSVIPITVNALDKGTGGFENKRTREDLPNYSIIKIGQNTEKSARDLRRLVANAGGKKLSNVIIIIIIIIIMIMIIIPCKQL